MRSGQSVHGPPQFSGLSHYTQLFIADGETYIQYHNDNIFNNNTQRGTCGSSVSHTDVPDEK